MNKFEDFLLKYQSFLPEEAVKDAEQLKHQFSYLSKAFDESPCTLALIDSNGYYINANKSLLDLVRLPKEKFIGTKVGTLTQNGIIYTLMNKIIDENQEQSSTIIETTLNNQKRIYLVTVSKVGKNYLSTGIDITKTKELEEENKFKDKMSILGEMSSFVVHEINNPLAAIKLTNEIIEFLNEENYQNGKLQECCGQINSMVDVISNIIISLKTLARKPAEQMGKIDFDNCLNKVKFILSGKLKKNKTELIINPVNIDFSSDEGEILQVLINLISNGVDAVKDLADKWVKVYQDKNKIIVQDSGFGIPEQFQSSLFKKFHTSKGQNGNGIGLFLSKEILNKYNADICYEKIDGHTSFVITFNSGVV
jgi:signal transduction histidine kinase